jgi:serine phosphatase RsbU (regulator of sigma subunit)
MEIGEGVLGSVAETRKSVLIPRRAENATGFSLPRDVETLMAVPMYAGNRFTGVICAVNRKKEGPGFTRDELRLFGELSSQAAFAVNLVSVYSAFSTQQNLRQEMSFGRELQRSLLPNGVPEWGDYRLAAYAESARQVAGDYYDFIPIDDDRLMLVVADATGKGVPACMLVAMFRACARAFAKDYRGMEDFLRRLNAQLHVDTDISHFITMAALVINRRTFICEYGNAGHTPLLVRSPEAGAVAIQPDGPAIGLFPQDLGLDFDTLSFRFRPGMEMLLFTDGITEALDREENEFGLPRLEQIWRDSRGDPEQMRDLIIQSVNTFSAGVERADDQTILVVGRNTIHESDANDAASSDVPVETPQESVSER